MIVSLCRLMSYIPSAESLFLLPQYHLVMLSCQSFHLGKQHTQHIIFHNGKWAAIQYQSMGHWLIKFPVSNYLNQSQWLCTTHSCSQCGLLLSRCHRLSPWLHSSLSPSHSQSSVSLLLPTEPGKIVLKRTQLRCIDTESPFIFNIPTFRSSRLPSRHDRPLLACTQFTSTTHVH